MKSLKRPVTKTESGSRHDPYRRTLMRSHVQSDLWTPKLPYRPGVWPEIILLFHTMPLDRPGEPLAFAVWQLIDANTWEGYDRGLVVGSRLDGLARRNLISQATELGIPGTHVDEQSQIGETIYRLCYQRRAALTAWDIGVTAGRLSIDWTHSNTGRTRNGLSLILSTLPGEPTDRRPERRNGEVEKLVHPNLRIRSLGATRALTDFRTPANVDKRDRKGTRRIISLQPMAQALSGVAVESPAQAAELWEIDSPDTIGHESDLGKAAGELDLVRRVTKVLFDEHRMAHPPPPGTATSAGTYAGGLFHRIGLVPPMIQHPNFPKQILAGAMGAYYAGDVFTRIRSRRLPIRKLDLGSAYAVSYHLTDSWTLYSARQLQVRRRDTSDTAEYVERVARRVEAWWQGKIDKPLTPDDWKRLARILVWVIPNDDWLPHRPRSRVANQGAQMVIGPLRSGLRPMPYFLADVLNSTLRTGKVPRIVEAVRLVPRGQQELETVALPTGRIVDPRGEDPVFVMACERLRIQGNTSLSHTKRDRLRGRLKGMAVAAASGLPMQVLDDEPTSKRRTMQVWDPLNPRSHQPELVKTEIVEEPGPWYFPPVGAAVTASARLLLQLCRGAFETAGGTVAYGDTDSLFVAETRPEDTAWKRGPVGWEVETLTRREIHDTQWKIETALSPYPPELRPYDYDLASDPPRPVPMPALLKVEPENLPPAQAWGMQVEGPYYDGNRSKRHRIYYIQRPGPHTEISHDGTPELVYPTDEETRRLSKVILTGTSLHGITYQKPQDAPPDFIEVLLAEHLDEHLQLGAGPDSTNTWKDEIAVSLVPATRMEAINLHPDNIPYSQIEVAESIFGQQLIAAHPRNGAYVTTTGTPVSFNLHGPETEDTDIMYQRARSIDFQLRRNTTAPPANALTDDDQPVGRSTYGTLKPAPTHVTGIDVIGRESRRWGDGRGILDPPEINTYITRAEPEAVVALILNHYWWRGASTIIAEKTGLPLRTVQRIYEGRPTSQENTERLWEFAYQQRLFDLD